MIFRRDAGQTEPANDQPAPDPQVTPAPGPGTAPAPRTTPAPAQVEPAQSPATQQPPAATQQPPPAAPPRRAIRRTRLSGVWVGLGLSAIVLLLLLVFILENGQRADVGYFGAHGHLPLGVALLLAAVAGALLVLIPGSARIIQLRRTARRHHKLASAAQTAAAQSPAPAQDPSAGQDPVPPAPGDQASA